jgi:hypothetical protein
MRLVHVAAAVCALSLVLSSVAVGANPGPQNALRGPGAVVPQTQASPTTWANPGFGWELALLAAGAVIVAGLALDYAFTAGPDRRAFVGTHHGKRPGLPHAAR